ncbi:MAG: TIGR03986 family type III CRISPR-associated RAMP protein [Gammaproteobacteria bacterium]
MGETLKATVKTRKVKSGIQALILVPSKKGQREQVLGPGIVSQNLAEVLNQDPAKLEGAEIEYVMEAGQVRNVRRAGQPWEPSAVHLKETQGPKQLAKSGTQSGSSLRGAIKGHQESTRKHQQAYGQNHSSTPKAHTGNLFENPYNFVPAPPRPLSTTDLRDHAPLGHHRYHPGHWSGRIGVKLTTVTPLLIPDTATVTDTDGHKTFGLRLDPHGAPYLPPTSVKGMLRTAYEAITNSRFGIVEDHNEKLAFRMYAKKALYLVPARIEDDHGVLNARLLAGRSGIDRDGMPSVIRTERVNGRNVEVRLMYAAWLPRYQKYRHSDRPARDKGETMRALKYAGTTTLPEHGHYVHVRVSQRTHGSGRFDYLKVEEIRPATPGAPPPSGWEGGWVCVTGRNIMNKHDERVFLQTPSSRLEPLSQSVIEQWNRLIRDYQAIHAGDLDERRRHGHSPYHYLGHDPGQTGWSRQVHQRDMENLVGGNLCYAKVKKRASGGFDVLALYPVMISRDLYELAPDKLLPSELELLPAPGINELSPADRVFGWVKGNGHGAFRGQLRVGPGTCEEGTAAIEHLDVRDDPEGLALAILGQPKPQQARFYLAQDKTGQPLEGGIAKDEGYSNLEQGLRGRKVYPHQRQGELKDYWLLERAPQGPLSPSLDGRHAYQEFRRLPDIEHENRARDNQNRSIRAWVKPETAFRFDLQVTNLSTLELGALLWLLRLPAKHYLRLGLGKPLGFGSVRLEIDALDLRDGEALTQDYHRLIDRGEGGRRLAGAADKSFGELVEIYTKAVMTTYKTASFEKVPFIRAFLNACRGGNLPVHYPRTSQETSSSKIYQWFVDNEKGSKNALPSLEEEHRGLPYRP